VRGPVRIAGKLLPNLSASWRRWRNCISNDSDQSLHPTTVPITWERLCFDPSHTVGPCAASAGGQSKARTKI